MTPDQLFKATKSLIRYAAVKKADGVEISLSKNQVGNLAIVGESNNGVTFLGFIDLSDGSVTYLEN